MASNAQKTPVSKTLDQFVRERIGDYLTLTGKSLPASVVSITGQIAVVSLQMNATPFTLPTLTVPTLGSEYVRVPIQPGCKGVVFSADAYLGAMSGLGGGNPGLNQPGNLSSLVFSPIGNAGWSSVDGNVLVMYGPQGVTLRDENSLCVMDLKPTGVTVTLGELTLTFNSSGLKVTGGDIVADTISLKTHVHRDTQPGSGDSGIPVA